VRPIRFYIFWGLVLLIAVFFIAVNVTSEIRGSITLAIESIGLFALISTLIEIRTINKKPDLRVWIGPINFSSDLISVGTAMEGGHISKSKTLDSMEVVWQIDFRFKIYIENVGNSIARFVRLQITEENYLDRDPSIWPIPSSNPKSPRLVNCREIRLENWVPTGSAFTLFEGGENFVVYSRDKTTITTPVRENITIPTSDLYPIGQFVLTIPVSSKNKNKQHSVTLDVAFQADKFPLSKSSLRFIPDTSSTQKTEFKIIK